MKKIVIGILSVAVILGAGTYTFAQTNSNGEGPLTFGQMKPYMEKMHPDLSTQELKDLYNSCHGSNGNNSNGMMNNL